jgi:hypothetical protein
MMNHTVITDVFGNKNIDYNKVPFILIQTTKPLLFLEKITNASHIDSIWKLNYSKLSKILAINQIDPKTFYQVGDIWIPSKMTPNKIVIILTNINYSTYPIDYIKIDTYTEFNIWKPLSPNGFVEMGNIASTNKPSLKEIRVVNSKYIKEYNGSSNVVGRNTNMNEFNLLSNIINKKYTIDNSKLINNSHNKKIIKENSDESTSSQSSESWKTHIGKKVMLIQPDIPWYITKKKTIPEYLIVQSINKLNEKQYRDNADFNSSVTINPNRPDMGYGYSYAQRKNQDAEYFTDYGHEEFSDNFKNKIDFNIIACSLLLLIFLLVVIRYYIINKTN